MIEAVNSVISNAAVLRQSAQQQDVASIVSAQQSAEAASVAKAPVAPYVSLFVSVDNNFDQAVLQIRDSDTGDVLNQYPTEPTLQARQRAEATRARAQAIQETRQLSAPTTSSEGGDGGGATVENLQAPVAVAQASPSQAAGGSGQAQAAIAALSAGAQSGQVSTTTVNVSA